jgi:hypothetical protein
MAWSVSARRSIIPGIGIGGAGNGSITVSGLFYDLKTLMKSTSTWAIDYSGYNTSWGSGDIITSESIWTSASTGAWFLARRSGKQFLFRRQKSAPEYGSSTSGFTRVFYSPTASFNSGSASEMPYAADEVQILGEPYSDSGGSSGGSTIGIWTPWITSTINTAAYGWVTIDQTTGSFAIFGTYTGGAPAVGMFAFDFLNDPIPTDSDKTAIWINQGGLSGLRCYGSQIKLTNLYTFTSLKLAKYTDSDNNIFNQSLVTMPYSAPLTLPIPLYVVNTFKGYSRIFNYSVNSLTNGDILGTYNICIDNFTLPWDSRGGLS